LPGFGFPLALQIPTNRQIKFCAPIFIFREEEDRRSTNYQLVLPVVLYILAKIINS